MQLPLSLRLLIIGAYCLLAGASAFASGGSSPGDYAGKWVMKLGQRNFILLTLRIENNKLLGSFSRPQHFQTSDGGSFSHISSNPVTQDVVRSSIHEGHLRFVAQHRADKTDEDEFDMTLTTADRASLKPAGFPFDPWLLSRVHGATEQAVASDWDAKQSYTPEESSDTPNAEIRRIFEADQKVRQFTKSPSQQEWTVIARQDAGRRDETRKLLAAGQLHAGEDFEQAAFIFQHGDSPDDFLLAHTLAIVAVAKGNHGAAWIAAATLDRYLQSAGKPQIYGTQYKSGSGEPATQEPYNRDLIPDALRRQLGVPAAGPR